MNSTEAYVVHEGNGGFHLEEVHFDGIGPHEILVEAVAIGVCHTDMMAQTGGFMLKPPMIPGHESAGIIKEVGSQVHGLKQGDSVILSFAPCWECKMCLSGRAPYCLKLFDLNFSGKRQGTEGTKPWTDKSGKQLNGFFFGQSSMSRLILAHANGAVKVDATREELKMFAALGCGIQTGAGAIMNVINPSVSSSIAIFGAGAVGLSAIYAAALCSPSHLILIDNSPQKIANLPKDLPATHVLDSSNLSSSIIETLLALTDGLGVDYVIDAVGSPRVLGDAHTAMAKCGTLVTLGGIMQPVGIEINAHLVKGGCWRGSHQGDSVPRIMLPKLIALWKQGKFPFDKMLSFYPFEELETALGDVKAGKIIKPVLVL